MRLIASFASEEDARLFGDVLYVKGLENDVEESSSGAWDVWVHDEDRLDEAGEELAVFKSAPEDKDYTEVIKQAEVMRKQAEEELCCELKQKL